MSLLRHAPRFDAAAAAALAREAFGVRGRIEPLTSERDQNFLIDTGQARVVLKIANGLEARSLLEAQNRAMTHLGLLSLCPRVIAAPSGETIVEAPGGHLVRLLEWVDGVPMALSRRHSADLFESLGRRLAEVDRTLETFDHPAIHREFHWDLAAGVRTVRSYLPLVRDHGLRAILERTVDDLEPLIDTRFSRLRTSAIHNDANDYNVLVNRDGDLFEQGQRVVGLIDFGDIIHGYMVGDLAVAIAYAILGKPDPLGVAARIVAGYHSVQPLTDDELSSLFALVKLRLCMSVAIAAHQQRERPDDEYLSVSQSGIRLTLPALCKVHPGFAEAAFRLACGRIGSAKSERIMMSLRGLDAARLCSEVVGLRPTGVEGNPLVLDLSVGSPLVFEIDEPSLTHRIFDAMRSAGAAVGVGRYGEPRLLYSSPLFASDSGERRTIHLGIDLFAPVNTPVRAPIDGTIHLATDNAAPLDYGPLIVLRHVSTDGDEFFTLYGHLTRASIASIVDGQSIAKGQVFAEIGPADVNGGWTPHLHFQLITDFLGLGRDFPGVCRPSEFPVWSAVSPDPNVLLRLSSSVRAPDARPPQADVAERRQRIGPNLRVGYRTPLKIVRGWMQYLFDDRGRRYLDGYNNVPHLGHSHPAVVRAASDQLRVLNTNTRYLHDNLAELSRRIAATMPEPLAVCYFVNSGSEANELALRLARAHTHQRDVIVLASAYHGNTTTLIDISPYKADGPGGDGRPPWVHVAPLPDVYRGPFKRDDPDAGRHYALAVRTIVDGLTDRGSGVAAFIAETCPSVGGQIIFPPRYLAEVYGHVRGAGGVCIADEVQTAYGRLGTSFYGFEDQQVVPDIVVLGKPIGNGYPLGAVVTTQAIAASFDNGMEFFSTFGGSTVSCAVGLAVIEEVRRSGLQAHALHVGERLRTGFEQLSTRHDVVGDVRGSGLFLGVELVRDRTTLEPAPNEADYVANRLREEGILIGTDGPFHNVLKVRPPMPFSADDAEVLIDVLDRVIGEI
jgi:4-aminobutyrate aminotransferase-like enzyme/Ser/Thr protein kinase RdoA (MazF antagonist)